MEQNLPDPPLDNFSQTNTDEVVSQVSQNIIPNKSPRKMLFFATLFGIALMVGILLIQRMKNQPLILAPQVTVMPSAQVESPASSPVTQVNTILERTKPVDSVLKLTQAHNSFGLNFLKFLASKSQNSDIFISPSSLELAFSMAFVGAASDVRQEMAQVLQFGEMSDAQIQQNSEALLSQIGSGDSDITVSIANSIWMQRPIEPQFLSTNEKFFKAHIEQTDLTSKSGINKVNSWVNEQTRTKIPQIFDIDKPLDPNVVAVLLNAVYFKGKWSLPFDKILTAVNPFTDSRGVVSQVQMMKQKEEGKYKYLENNLFQAVYLPYGRNGDWNMVVFLPKTSIQQFLSQLAHTNWDAWQEQFLYEDGVVELPRFTMQYELKLEEIMPALGMRLAFIEGDRFPGMGSQIYLGAGIHKTFVEVNEEGTEAAAVTALIPISGGVGVEPPHFTFIANRPFVYAIVDNITQAIVFIGVQKTAPKP